MNCRLKTRELLDLIDNGVLTNELVVNMCLNYMSEQDVADMMSANDIAACDEDEDDEDDEDDEEEISRRDERNGLYSLYWDDAN